MIEFEIVLSRAMLSKPIQLHATDQQTAINLALADACHFSYLLTGTEFSVVSCVATPVMIEHAQSGAVSFPSIEWSPITTSAIKAFSQKDGDRVVWIYSRMNGIRKATYDWRQGRSPDRWIIDGVEDVSVFGSSFTHFAPYTPPSPPRDSSAFTPPTPSDVPMSDVPQILVKN